MPVAAGPGVELDVTAPGEPAPPGRDPPARGPRAARGAPLLPAAPAHSLAPDLDSLQQQTVEILAGDD